jgi:hypothetical protein
MLFNQQTKDIFEMPWGWERVEKTQEIIIPKLKILADKMECLIAEIYGSDVLNNYGHKSVPSSANGISGYTRKVRKDKPFDESKNNLSDIEVGITPNASGTKVLRANIDKIANLVYYDKVYGELCVNLTEMRGAITLCIRFGVATYGRVKYNSSVYRTYADNVEKLRLTNIIEDEWEEDYFSIAHLPKSGNLNSCTIDDVDGIVTPKILRSGFAFLLFGERFLFDEELQLDDYAELILRGAAIFPLLDVFVRQVSDQPVDTINYRELFKNWCQNYSSKFFSQFDLNSELNGEESQGESITRELIERIFGKPFVKERPKWLKENSRSRSLELDGYNRELQIAFEYQGEQHYHFIPIFHGTVDAFEKQIERDKIKAEICIKAGVRLVQVPYTKKGDLQFIIDELHKLGVNL